MKVNGPREKKVFQGRNPWQLVKRAWLYSDIPQALKGEQKNEGEWTEREESISRKKSLAVGGACVAVFRHSPGFKGRTF